MCLRDLETVIRVNLGEHHTDMTLRENQEYKLVKRENLFKQIFEFISI